MFANIKQIVARCILLFFGLSFIFLILSLLYSVAWWIPQVLVIAVALVCLVIWAIGNA